jgi:hypothetical protein
MGSYFGNQDVKRNTFTMGWNDDNEGSPLFVVNDVQAVCFGSGTLLLSDRVVACDKSRGT